MANRSFGKPYENSTETLSVSNLASGFTYTFTKKGDMYRIDCGVDSSNPPACPSGNTVICVLPSGAQPKENVYFPCLYRILNDNTFYVSYGALYANRNVSIYLPSGATIRQLVLGQTYFSV